MMIMKLLALLSALLVGTPSEPPAGAEPTVAGGHSSSQPAAFANAGELLDALEEADRDVRTFTARIRYVRVFALAGDVQTRLGWLSFRTDPPAEAVPNHLDPATNRAVRKRSVAVRFDTFIAGGRQDVQDRLWVFDGEWLVEKDPAERQFIKRRMVRPGQIFDPLRVGEGPFFVPIGQRRNDMENFFHTELRPSSHGLSADDHPQQGDLFEALAAKLTGFIQLELRPRDGIPEVEDFELIRIWYDPQTLLPRASLTVDPLGDVDVFELFDIDINEARRPIAADAFSVKIPDPGEGYHVEVIDGTTP